MRAPFEVIFPTNPFWSLEMINTPSQFAEMQKSQIDTLYALSHVAFDATEKLVDLNLAAVKAAMDESAVAAQSLLGVKDAQEFVSIGTTAARPALDKFVGYSRNVYGIVSGAGAEFKRVLESQFSDGSTKMNEFVEFAAKNAPAGSEPMISLLRNSVAACNTAYDTFTKAAQQAFEVAEANMANATQAAVTAVSETGTAKPARGKKAE
jgi:phasin family protein